MENGGKSIWAETCGNGCWTGKPLPMSPRAPIAQSWRPLRVAWCVVGALKTDLHRCELGPAVDFRRLPALATSASVAPAKPCRLGADGISGWDSPLQSTSGALRGDDYGHRQKHASAKRDAHHRQRRHAAACSPLHQRGFCKRHAAWTKRRLCRGLESDLRVGGSRARDDPQRRLRGRVRYVRTNVRDSAPAFICARGFSCFRVDPEIYRRVGRFDEEFYPAYWEDADYRRRLQLSGIPIIEWSSEEVEIISPGRTRTPSGIVHGKHAADGSYQGWTGEKLKWFWECYEANGRRYAAKWGGQLGNETFETPFNQAAVRPNP